MMPESGPIRRVGRPIGPLPAHGTRSRYQRPCHCRPCQLANAAYMVNQRRLVRHGAHRTRELVDGKAARVWVRAMRREGFTYVLIAQALGIGEFRGVGPWVTRARHQALERLYRTRVADPDGICVTESSAVENRAK